MPCILFRLPQFFSPSFPFFVGSLCKGSSCGGTVWIAGVPGAARNALSGISELGREATVDATAEEVTAPYFT